MHTWLNALGGNTDNIGSCPPPEACMRRVDLWLVLRLAVLLGISTQPLHAAMALG